MTMTTLRNSLRRMFKSEVEQVQVPVRPPQVVMVSYKDSTSPPVRVVIDDGMADTPPVPRLFVKSILQGAQLDIDRNVRFTLK